MSWQPIETAPNSTKILAWMEGFEDHAGGTWRRFGFEIIALHGGVISSDSLMRAKERIIGPNNDFTHFWHLYPTYWMPLPEPPE